MLDEQKKFPRDDADERRSVVVVVNPKRREVLEQFVEALGDERPVRVVELDHSEDVDAALAEAAGTDGTAAGIVAAIGGDGTQRAVAAQIRGTDAVLAVVPGGTVNLFAQVLGIDSVDDAVDAVRLGDRRVLDTGTANGEPFLLQASTGFDAAVMDRVDDSAKRWGRLGYFVTGLRTLRTHRPRRVTVVVDGDTFHRGRAMTVMVTNVGQRGSPEFTVAQGSAPDDGLLDVVVQRSDSVSTMARALWALFRGRTPRAEDLVVAHGRVVEVRWAEPTRAQRDGDAVGWVRDVRHEIDPRSLTVCVPRTT